MGEATALLAEQCSIDTYASTQIITGGCAVRAATAGSDIRKVGSVGPIVINLGVLSIAAAVEGPGIVDDSSQ